METITTPSTSVTKDTPLMTPEQPNEVADNTVVDRDHRGETIGDVTVENPRMTARNVNVWYGEKHTIRNVNLDIAKNEVAALIGPSGCGKSTFLRCLNRMNDTIDICRVEGDITLDGKNIYDKDVDVVPLRARVGIVFQNPTPFLNQFMKMLPMALAFMAWQERKVI